MTEQETPPGRPRVIIYTDGGADPNPGTGGWGAILIDARSGRRREMSGGEPRTTNNRMELTAAIEALGALRRSSEVELHTDSQYLRRGVTRWLPDWMRRGWKRKTGEVLNLDLWQRLAELKERHEIRWHWVRGHSGNAFNERADQLATAEIRRRKGAGTCAPAAGGAAHRAAPGAEPQAEVWLRVSCLKGQGAWAALLRTPAGEETLSGEVAGTTSNQLDLLGACAALERLPEGIPIAVRSASDYLRSGASHRVGEWSRKGWKTRDGEPVKNRELWQRLAAAAGRRQVTWLAPGDPPPAELKRLDPVLEAARARLACSDARGG